MTNGDDEEDDISNSFYSNMLIDNNDNCLYSVSEHSKAVVSLKYSFSGQYIATACKLSVDVNCWYYSLTFVNVLASDKKSSVINVRTGELLQSLVDETSLGLNDCAWIGNQYICTGSDDKLIRLFDFQLVWMTLFV